MTCSRAVLAAALLLRRPPAPPRGLSPEAELFIRERYLALIAACMKANCRTLDDIVEDWEAVKRILKTGERQ